MRKWVVIAVLLIFLVSAVAMTTAKPKKPEFKPSHATDIELVKKVTLKGPKAKAKPPHAGKPKKQAATGVLGDVCGEGCTKYAIVIGISDYPGEDADLNYADDDARLVYNILLNVYGFDVNNVYLLIDDNATIDNIVAAINEVKSKAQSGDGVFFFFSGHGSRGRADDGDKEKVDEAIVVHNGTDLVWLWDGDLKRLFSGFNTSRIIFAFDSCLAGGMTDLADAIRVIAMASTENTYSYEGGWGGGHGEFTYYFFMEGIQNGYADVYDHNGNETLQESFDTTIEEAFDYAKASCEYDKPTISDSFENDLLP